MNEWPRFPRAPITEALLDIRAKLPPGINLETLDSLHFAIKDRYPTKRQRFFWQAEYQFKPGESIQTVEPSSGPDGFLFTSNDGRQIVQARLDGFTFNRLKPYDKWETFRDEARVHWQKYCEIASPEVASRVALRYINRIEIPFPIKDFKEYVLTGPEISPALPQGLSTFFMRVVIPSEKSNSIAIVTETMEPPQEKTLPLILDIDAYVEGAFDPHSPDQVSGLLEQLREYKNEIFFGSITDKTKELFK